MSVVGVTQPRQLVVGVTQPRQLVVGASVGRTRQVVLAGARGREGPRGVSAPGADGSPVISADAENRIELGGDGGLYVLDNLVPDPLAYYILSRS